MRVELVLTALFIIIMTAMFASMRPLRIENFNDTPEAKGGEHQLASDRVLYLKVGLINFFAQPKNVVNLGQAALMKFAEDKVLFWPNYIDICCKSTTIIDDGNVKKAADCDCDNISLMTSSCVDETLTFMNEKRIRTIQGSIGAPSTANCTMSIFGCDYKIMKRSIKLNIASVLHTGAFSTPRFEVTLIGNAAPLILSRPIFIAFNMGGLYRTIHEDSKTVELSTEDILTRNALSNFDSTQKEHKLKLEKIMNADVFGKHIYIDTPNTIAGITGEVPLTLFYVNFDNELQHHSMTSNVYSLIIDNDTIPRIFDSRTQITILTGAQDSSYASKLVVKKMVGKGFIIQIDDVDYNIPAGFNIDEFSKFHITITYSYDILMIVCFGIKAITRKNVCYMTRYHTPKIFQMKKGDLKKAIKENGLKPENLHDVFSSTGIPNYALLAYKLGYVFDIF